MSREAIAAALAREDLSCGERLVAFSLASFADRENRARPGTPAAAGRAGLARSRFLEARDRLVRRGLVVVEDVASGRGRASTVALLFAERGRGGRARSTRSCSRRSSATAALAGPPGCCSPSMAALADEQGVVEGVTTERLCAAAGVADRTYRRARATLLASGEVVLRSGSGGRGNTNCWEIPDPRTHRDATQPAQGRRVPPPAGARPLMATVAAPAAGGRKTSRRSRPSVVPDAERSCRRGCKGRSGSDGFDAKGSDPDRGFRAKGGQDRTLPEQNRPAADRGFGRKGRSGPDSFSGNPGKNPGRNPGAQRARG